MQGVTTWTLVGSRGAARLFEGSGVAKSVSLVKEFHHPRGRAQNQELTQDRPGRSSSSHGKARHAMQGETSPTTEESRKFAKRLVTVLQRGRNRQSYQRLILIADSTFVGELRQQMDPATADLVVDSIDRNWVELSEEELNKQMEKHVRL